MEASLTRILWIVGGLVLTAFIVFTVVNFGISAMQRADLSVLDIQAYDDGTVYFTLKNTGTVPLTGVKVDGKSASGTIPLEGGEESQFTASGLSLTAGQMHTFTVTATFSNGQTKTIRVKAIVQRA
ncbi:MAG: hypothetical protein J7K23_08030 [Thermoproteales archaeon]|nr:hypothetical protein [Thermoproteales archaeon]